MKTVSFVLTILSWLFISLFGSLPFIYTSASLSYTDSFFESVSGITTTGSTVINNLDSLPEGILIWRSLLQWFGGIGIIVLASAEIMVRYSGISFDHAISYYLIPLLFSPLIYFLLIRSFKYENLN